jgi:hypothetical protein
MNWFLYIVTEEFIDDEGKRVPKGDAGVGKCSMNPGISDAFHGIMYIAPESYILQELRKMGITRRHPSAMTIRKIIEKYYKEKEVIEISPDDKNFFIE